MKFVYTPKTVVLTYRRLYGCTRVPKIDKIQLVSITSSQRGWGWNINDTFDSIPLRCQFKKANSR